jgi:hypothetical protein
MSEGLKTYDPTLVTISFGAVPLVGFADGTFISASRTEDSFTHKVGADGSGARSKTANKSGLVTVTLLQTSSSNDYLSALNVADELSNAGVLPLLIKDAGGTSLLFAAEAYIVKPPDYENAKEILDRAWQFMCNSLDFFVGGNLNASS